MMKKALTITVVANMTSNYSEGLGNISSVQKVFKNQKIYATRSRESLKNALCVQAGLYDDLRAEQDGATQKYVAEDVNAATCKALEGGYMSTKGTTYVRKSSFYLTDAISCDSLSMRQDFTTIYIWHLPTQKITVIMFKTMLKKSV